MLSATVDTHNVYVFMPTDARKSPCPVYLPTTANSLSTKTRQRDLKVFIRYLSQMNGQSYRCIAYNADSGIVHKGRLHGNLLYKYFF